METASHAPGFFTQSLQDSDPDVFGSVTGELGRQREEIELIASENIASVAVMEAQGCVMTNKYAEGYVGRRYYGGCQFVDVAETLAIERACQLFECEFANVQPNSGSQANQGVFTALLQPGDTILGMSLDAGGHLTHGAAPNQSGKWFNAVQYGVRREDNMIDYDEVAALAKEHQPKLLIAGGSAVPRQIDFAKMREIADSVGAYLHVDMAHFAGLVAAGAHPSPFPHAHVATTTTHKTLRPPRRDDSDQRRGAGQKVQQCDLSRHSRRATNACDCRQSRCVWRGAATRVQNVHQRRDHKRPSPERSIDQRRARHCDPRHRYACCSG